MAECRLSPRAEADLEEIWRYTVEHWSEKQAEKYVSSLIDEIEALARNPSRGRKADDIRKGYHRRNVGSHIIFYKLGDRGIVVIRILHQQMDIDAHFN